MNKKRIVSLAIWLALPFAANATDPVVAVGPAHASSNPVVATANAPYVTVTPSTADESHIATTAYVKGAYNDTIAAVNNVADNVATLTNEMADKQDKFVAYGAQYDIDSGVFDASAMTQYMADAFDYGHQAGLPDNEMLNLFADETSSNVSLITMGGTLYVAASLLEREGVEIYTTWDDDSATTGLLLKDVSDVLP